MRGTWMVLLVGCGFQGQSGPSSDDAGPVDAASADVATDVPSLPAELCWRLISQTPNVNLSICLPSLVDRVELTADTSIDTSTGISTNPDIRCALLTDGPDGPDDVCVLSAQTITIRSSVTLSAHGDRPLVLLAHNVDVQGTIDVASHIATPDLVGAGAIPSGCNPGDDAKGGGGGGGGGFDHAGGDGGDQGGMPMTHGEAGATISVLSLRGGCEGNGGGKAETPAGRGGAGGGAVWISANTGTLTFGNNAVINASGAGGAAGIAGDHGGDGGGSGGLIVLQAPTIRLGTNAAIFAKGGGGGGGASGVISGMPGRDPVRGQNGGEGGKGGGGSTGIIWVASTSALDTTNISPEPVVLVPPPR